jgi:glycosyltransferase involved in cell wall biosynthesis
MVSNSDTKMSPEVRPLVSVLIPTYNVAPYIREAMSSILKQTYSPIEVIVVDDASTDGTFEILQEIERDHQNITLLRNDVNKKIVYTLNRALDNASGSLIARMDGDDVAAPERIERQVRFLKENDDVDLVGTNLVTIDVDGNPISRSVYPSDPDLIEKTFLLSTPVSHIWVCRRKVYDELGGYREIPYAEDYDFLLRMKTKGYTFSNIEYDGMYIRILREGNSTLTHGLKQRKAFEYTISLYKERRRKGSDSFTPERMQKTVESSHFLRKLHRHSNSLLKRAIEKKSSNSLLAALYAASSCLISPYQARYIYRRALRRFYMGVRN